jgi:hypothetical protein
MLRRAAGSRGATAVAGKRGQVGSAQRNASVKAATLLRMTLR